MEKSVFEQMGGSYVRQGNYLIPCLTLPAEKEQPIGVYGQRHLRYLKQYRRITYTNLLTSGKLNAYLAEIDGQAKELLFRLVKEYADRQGVTERLKADNPPRMGAENEQYPLRRGGSYQYGTDFCIEHGEENNNAVF